MCVCVCYVGRALRNVGVCFSHDKVEKMQIMSTNDSREGMSSGQLCECECVCRGFGWRIDYRMFPATLPPTLGRNF